MQNRLLRLILEIQQKPRAAIHGPVNIRQYILLISI